MLQCGITSDNFSTWKMTDITHAMVNAAITAGNMKIVPADTIGKTTTGTPPSQGTIVVCATPKASNIVFTKDDGLGSKVPFNGPMYSTNGDSVTWNGELFGIYGELDMTGVQTFIYADKV